MASGQRIGSRVFFNLSFAALLAVLLLSGCGSGGGGESASGGTEPPTGASPTGASPTGASPTGAPSTAILAWDAVTATNLNGYRIYYGTNPGRYLQSVGQGINVGRVESYTLNGLASGTRYYFAVTAFDTSGNESAFSNEVFKDIP